MSDSDYVRGLVDAAKMVSAESDRRRHAGEKQAMYALNTVWHALQHAIEKAAAPPQPPSHKEGT